MLNNGLIGSNDLLLANSSLRCRFLNHDPERYRPGDRSPHCPTLINFGSQLGAQVLPHAQFEVELVGIHQRWNNAFRGFAHGWFNAADNRAFWGITPHPGGLHYIATVFQHAPTCG